MASVQTMVQLVRRITVISSCISKDVTVSLLDADETADVLAAVADDDLSDAVDRVMMRISRNARFINGFPD